MGIIKYNKLFLPKDQLDYLSKTIELGGLDKFIDRVKLEMEVKGKKESDLYDRIETGSERGYADRVPDHKEYNLGMNKKLTNHNPNGFPPRLFKRIEKKLGVTESGVSENALWLTSYAYEFFFISMVNIELEENKGDFLTPLNGISDVEDSFTQLKKGFQLIFEMLSLGLGQLDFNPNMILLGKNEEDIIKQSVEDVWRTRWSEGFVNFGLPEWYLDSETINEDGWNGWPVLNTFFLELFINDAEKLIENKGYSFNRRDKNIMNFYVRDFMPLVVEKIKSYLDSDGASGYGFKIYHLMKKAFEASYYSMSEANRMVDQIHGILKYGKKSWERWFEKMDDSAKLYQEWVDRRNDDSTYFDDMKNKKTVDELLNNTFNDKRTTKGRYKNKPK